MGNIAVNLNVLRGINILRIALWLKNKPDKNPEEEMALKAFWKVLRGICILMAVLFSIAVPVIVYAIMALDIGYKGAYEEYRTGRVENGQVRYILNEIYYAEPEEIGLPEELVTEGRKIKLYFDENESIVAWNDEDAKDAEVDRRFCILLGYMLIMIVTTIKFYIIARKTFGKPWYDWIKSVRNR